jgi:hypothetical protein
MANKYCDENVDRIAQHHDAEEATIMKSKLLHSRSLDDIDVREEENDTEIGADSRIEFATFAEGEYVESILIRRGRATEIYRNLGKSLSCGDACRFREGAIMSDSTRIVTPSKLEANSNPLDPASYTYRVTWVIDLEADSVQEAAAKARRIQLNPESAATVFEVQSRDGTTVSIDAETREESH